MVIKKVNVLNCFVFLFVFLCPVKWQFENTCFLFLLFKNAIFAFWRLQLLFTVTHTFHFQSSVSHSLWKKLLSSEDVHPSNYHFILSLFCGQGGLKQPKARDRLLMLFKKKTIWFAWVLFWYVCAYCTFSMSFFLFSSLGPCFMRVIILLTKRSALVLFISLERSLFQYDNCSLRAVCDTLIMLTVI